MALVSGGPMLLHVGSEFPHHSSVLTGGRGCPVLSDAILHTGIFFGPELELKGHLLFHEGSTPSTRLLRQRPLQADWECPHPANVRPTAGVVLALSLPEPAVFFLVGSKRLFIHSFLKRV